MVQATPLRTRRRLAVALVVGAALSAALVLAVFFALHDRARRRLEQGLEAALDAERARMPERRPALRDPRSGDLLVAIDEALAMLRRPPPPRSARRTSGFSFDDDMDDETALTEKQLDDAEPFVEKLRAALGIERADVLARLLARPRPAVGSPPPPSLRLWQLERAREVLDRLARRSLASGRPLEAAQLALDRWQLEHDLIRADPTLHARPEAVLPADELLVAAIPLLDARGLDAIAGELDRLEAGTPRCADAFRRRRLLAGMELRRQDRTKAQSELSWWGHFAEPPDVFWPKVNAVLDLGAQAAAAPWHEAALDVGLNTPGIPDAVGTLVAPLVLNERREECEVLTLIRGARVLACAHRFRLAHGRLPSSLEEALGRPASAAELDPDDGRPLELAVEDAKLRVIARFATGVGE